jgi:chromosome partitioning protein
MIARTPSARVLALLSQKGGSGKTALATHLAVALGQNRRVVLVDTDPQRSAAAWAQTRQVVAPQLVEAEAGPIAVTLRGIRASGADLVIIDSMPSVASDITSIARQADLVLIPCRPSILDLRAVGGTVALVKQQARVEALIVLNAVAARRGAGEATATYQARLALAQYGLPIAPLAVGYRVDLASSPGGCPSRSSPSNPRPQRRSARWPSSWSLIYGKARSQPCSRQSDARRQCAGSEGARSRQEGLDAQVAARTMATAAHRGSHSRHLQPSSGAASGRRVVRA